MNDSENLSDNPLDNLHDIHFPEAVSYWPPAPGWWLLIILSVILVIVGYWLYRRVVHPNIRKQALAELAKLNQQLEDNQYPNQFFIDVSILIRRIAITVFGRKQVAGLAGESWLKFLDETSKSTFFTTGNGRLLATAPYSEKKYDKNYHESSIAVGGNGGDVDSEEKVVEKTGIEKKDIEQFSNEIKRWVLKNT